MKIISFGWTSAALLTGAKSVTRRSWDDQYARTFKAGELVAAYDRSPRYKGRQIATIRLTQAPYQENIADAPDEDYEKEGLAWMERRGLLIQEQNPRVFWQAWKQSKELVWVVRFELVHPIEVWRGT